MFRTIAAAAASAVLLSATTAQAGEAETRERLETVAAHSVAIELCRNMGWPMTDGVEATLAASAKAEAVRAGMPATRAASYYDDARDRELQSLRAQIEAVPKLVNSDTLLQGVVGMAKAGEAKCMAAVQDPLVRTLVKAPDLETRTRLRVAFQDQMLIGNNEVSWETPATWARADLVYAVGVCRRQMTRAEITRDLDGLIVSPKPADPEQAKILSFYDGAYDRGVAASDEFAFDKTQCDRYLATNRAKVTRTR